MFRNGIEYEWVERPSNLGGLRNGYWRRVKPETPEEVSERNRQTALDSWAKKTPEQRRKRAMKMVAARAAKRKVREELEREIDRRARVYAAGMYREPGTPVAP